MFPAVALLSCKEQTTQPLEVQQDLPLTTLSGRISNWSYGDTNSIRILMSTPYPGGLILDSALVAADGTFSLRLPSPADSSLGRAFFYSQGGTRVDSAKVGFFSDLLVLAPSGRRIGWVRNCNPTFWSYLSLSDYSAYFLYLDREIPEQTAVETRGGTKPYTLYATLRYKNGWNKIVDRVTAVSNGHRTMQRTVENNFVGEYYLDEW